MPSANGHGPRDVGMSGCMVGWLLACLVAWLVDWCVGGVVGTKPAQNPPRWAPESSQDPPSWGSKPSTIGPKTPLGEVLGDLGSKMAPQELQERKCNKNLNIFTPLLGAKSEPKSIKNRSWGDPKVDRFFDRFLDRLLKRFGANLAPTWLPKPSQNGAKLGSKSMQVGVLI